MGSKHRKEAEDQRSTSATASRRDFLKRTAAGLVSVTLTDGALAGVRTGTSAAEMNRFRSRWPKGVTRTWIGPDFWSNPLQDWRVSDGRLELIADGADRNVHLLTRSLSAGQGTLDVHVTVGFVPGIASSRRAGFFLGVRGPLNEYRNNAIHGTGLKCGITSEGRLFIGGNFSTVEDLPAGHEATDEDVGWPDKGIVDAERLKTPGGIRLRLRVVPADGTYAVSLSAHDVASDEVLGTVKRSALPAEEVRGNLGLFADSEDKSPRGGTRLWFEDLEATGSKLDRHDDRAFGPILFAQYTLSRGVLKITAQMPPMGADEDRTVRLLFRSGKDWEFAAEQRIDDLARTARFRIGGWDGSRDVSYRLAYRFRRGSTLEFHHFEGTIRRDPVQEPTLVMGVLSCATDFVFPNSEIAEGLRRHDPDLLAFTGDQFYESSGGYGVERRRDDVPLSTLDYLRKWYMHGWSFGDLMRDRPTICMPDDHDVYQGNLWGAGGRAAETMDGHNDGGYYMPAAWVNMVERTQTSHLPDPYDPTPVLQDIGVYYTDMVYGRVSLAILEDRKWKSGPDGLIPPHPGRPDHITDPNFDPATVDVPGAELLGERQLAFLDAWASDWRGADMKVIISQTAFASVANLHGRQFTPLVADLDSNGWPQTPRNEAIRRFRKAFALQVGGDQHLPMVARYGIDEHDDSGYVFCVPAVSAGYPRAFEPDVSAGPPSRLAIEAGQAFGAIRDPNSDYAGQYVDGLGNRFTMHAVANPRRRFRENLLEMMHDRVSGYGIVRIDKEARSFTLEAWPLLSDPTDPRTQFPGWPVIIPIEDNYGRPAEAHLPTLIFARAVHPVVQVVDEESGETVYTLRIRGRRFRPKVFRSGTYTIRVGDDTEWLESVRGIRSTDTREEIHINL